jgi:hypothetical protein
VGSVLSLAYHTLHRLISQPSPTPVQVNNLIRTNKLAKKQI